MTFRGDSINQRPDTGVSDNIFGVQKHDGGASLSLLCWNEISKQSQKQAMKASPLAGVEASLVFDQKSRFSDMQAVSSKPPVASMENTNGPSKESRAQADRIFDPVIRDKGGKIDALVMTDPFEKKKVA